MPEMQESQASGSAFHRGAVIALGGIGVLVLGILPPTTDLGAEGRIWAEFGIIRWGLLALVVGLAFIPAIHRAVFPLLERLRQPAPATRRRLAVALAIAAGLYFLWTAHWQGRDLFPKTHDEQSYLLQMRMLAEGKLWLPQHPLADWFETFHVTVKPVYASVYFPGTALLYFPGLLLAGIGWPMWLLPIIVSAACVGLLYSIASELVDGLAGLVAAVALASLSWFRVMSVLLMGQVPALFFGLLMFWAWLRWREARRVREGDSDAAGPAWAQWAWVAVIGAAAGWMAITRPVDAVCYAIPVGIGVLIDLYRRRDRAVRWGMVLGLLVLAAAPFLTLQAIFNRGVTGSYMTPPFEFYIDQFQPQTSFGFHKFDPDIRPATTLPQKQALYDLFVVPRAQQHKPSELLNTWTSKYLKFTIDVTLPARPLLVLVPIGLLGLVCLRRRVLLSTILLFMGLYALYTFYLEHYIVVVAPAALLLVVLAIPVLEKAWPRRRPAIVTAVTAGILFVCFAMLPEVNRTISDETFPSPMLRALRNDVPYAIDGKAVILVRWTPGATFARNYHQEPVYNTESAAPDDNRIIFAHDLGGAHAVGSPEWWRANRGIFEYYAEKQPERMFYLFDRSLVDVPTGELIRELGRAPGVATRARQATSQ